MTLFAEEPEEQTPSKLKKATADIKWLKVSWWLDDHQLRFFLIVFLVILIMTCGGC